MEKDVQNLIKLASWKDVNVAALRASAVRSHHQLYKSVRKLRAVLQKPASDFFNPPEAEQGGSASYVSQSTYRMDERLITLIALISISNALSLPTEVSLPSLPANLVPSSKAHLTQLDQTYKRLSSLTVNKLSSIVGQDLAVLLEDFSNEIVTTAKDLRNEPLGEEEGREARVKNLIERKRRAWRDLLNELKRIGISPSPSPKTVARLEDAGQVYSLVPSQPLLALDSSALPGDVQVRLRKADAYHYRLLSELPTLKTYPASHNADVRTPDIQRALGHIQFALSLTFDQRIELIDATSKQVHLDRLIDRIESVSTSTACQGSSSALPLAQQTLVAISQAFDALSETRDELSRYRSASDSPTDAIHFSSLVNDSIATLGRDQDKLTDAVSSMGAQDPILSTAEEMTLVSNSHEHLNTSVASLASLSVSPSLTYLHDPLHRFLSTLLDETNKSALAPTTSLSTLQASHDNLISSILVVAQELLKLGNDESKVSEGEDLADGGVTTANKKLRATLSTLRLAEMSTQIEDFAREASRKLVDSQQVSFCLLFSLLRLLILFRSPDRFDKRTSRPCCSFPPPLLRVTFQKPLEIL